MAELSLSEEVLALLEAHLHSYEKLEILHALRIAGSAMSRAEVVRASRLDEETVTDGLAELVASGMVELHGARVRLAAGARHATCEKLMKCYEEDRAVVLSVLSTISVRRIRSLAARAFADAFVIRKKGRDGDG